MKKKILSVALALVGVWATAFANQTDYYGTWTWVNGVVAGTETFTISAEELIYGGIYEGSGPTGSVTISNPIWTSLSNDDVTAEDYPSGYLISGIVTSASGIFSFMLGQESSYPLYINKNDNTTFVFGKNVYTKSDDDTSDETISADTNKAPVAFYNLMGVQLQSEPASGVYVILYDNGGVEKVIKLSEP